MECDDSKNLDHVVMRLYKGARDIGEIKFYWVDQKKWEEKNIYIIYEQHRERKCYLELNGISKGLLNEQGDLTQNTENQLPHFNSSLRIRKNTKQ